MSKKKKAYQLMKRQRDYLYHFYVQTCIFFNTHLLLPPERKYPTLFINMESYVNLFNKLSKDILNQGEPSDPETLNEIGSKWKDIIPETGKKLEKLIGTKGKSNDSIDNMYG